MAWLTMRQLLAERAAFALLSYGAPSRRTACGIDANRVAALSPNGTTNQPKNEL
jgi:hypothetical protein